MLDQYGRGYAQRNGHVVNLYSSDDLSTGYIRWAKRVYVNAFDNAGLLTHWVQAATLQVQ